MFAMTVSFFVALQDDDSEIDETDSACDFKLVSFWPLIMLSSENEGGIESKISTDTFDSVLILVSSSILNGSLINWDECVESAVVPANLSSL